MWNWSTIEFWALGEAERPAMKQAATALPWRPRSGSMTRVLAGEHFLLIGNLSRVCSSWKYNFKIIIWMSQSSGPGSFFLKTYTVFVWIARPFSPLNTFSGIMALQERNEVNNYEHYKCGERIWQRFDTNAERFIWHHPLLGFISIFVGMPLLVLACVCISTIVVAFPMAWLLGWL